MPTYAYRCRRCGHEFDVFQKITDPPRSRCPVCRGSAERVITGGGGFLLRGEGFYSTDYRSESYRKAAEAEAKGSGEAKPAPAGAAKDGEGGAKETGAAVKEAERKETKEPRPGPRPIAKPGAGGPRRAGGKPGAGARKKRR
jgi:putative FmdB family regulatory protein